MPKPKPIDAAALSPESRAWLANSDPASSSMAEIREAFAATAEAGVPLERARADWAEMVRYSAAAVGLPPNGPETAASLGLFDELVCQAYRDVAHTRPTLRIVW